ncbi:AfsR/SARP family transcriptional regulator [Pseudonocardia sp.]|uniref:AfsR/SARP family transcriptional regulator n=1 Tax=Pseudonocardia sp. TaxID=60912 RepID=UPI003D0FBFD0
MELRVLGEIDVRVAGVPVELGHTRQRTVFAVLAVELNRVVAAEALIHRVWADRPPYRARNALSAYVSRLRHCLDPVAGVRLSRGAGGYGLAADPDRVDLHRFRALSARARATGQPDGAADLFAEALALWRGTPFGPVDTPWFDDVRTSLLAERFAAELDRNDAALAAGRHAELLVGLLDAVRANPLDERLAGQLMLCQARGGRQADALATYAHLRERLRDELGADPGAGLRAVHQQVLAGEPAPPVAATPVVTVADVAGPGQAAARGAGVGSAAGPGAAVASAAAPGATVAPATVPGAVPGTVPGAAAGPARAAPAVAAPAPVARVRPAGPVAPALPRRPTSFIGRREELDAVVTALQRGPLVTLVGVGGVGKSRLALEVAARVESSFADGARLCELAAVGDGAAVGHAVAAVLRVQQRPGLSIDESVVEYLRGRELLLVVDNCEHILDPVARLVDAVVRECPSVTVLATSRAALGVEGERLAPVQPLSDADAQRLFADRAAAQRPGFAGDETVAELCRRLDGLPLAIELAAARMRVMNAAEVVRRLDAGRFVGVAARGAPPRHQSLAAAVDWSYRLLSEPEQRLFARLSVFAGGFDAAAVHGVCGTGSLDDTLDLLIGLVDKSMVTVLGTEGRTRYRVLETLRAYGRERLAVAGEETASARRHAAWFAEFAGEVGAGLHGPHERAWVERAMPDHDNLRTAVERALADADGDTALRLVTSAWELVHLRVGYVSAGWAVDAHEIADPGHPLLPAAVGAASRGAWNRGDFTAARTLAARAGGRVPGRGTDRVAYPADVLADVALYEGDADAALRHYTSEVRRARRQDDPIRLVWTLYYVAVCHAVLREPERGLAAAAESVEVADTTGNPTALAMARYALGLVLKKTEPARALELFDESAALAASVRNFWWHGIALMEAAATRAVHGDPHAAARAFLGVLDHWDRAGDRTQQWLNLRYVARLLVRLGADGDALALHRALVAAGRPSPLHREWVAGHAAPGPRAARSGAVPSGSGAAPVADLVALARQALRRHG